MRPTSFIAPMCAMPTTTVVKTIGAISIFTSLMKPSPSGFIAAARSGSRNPNRTPRAMPQHLDVQVRIEFSSGAMLRQHSTMDPFVPRPSLTRRPPDDALRLGQSALLSPPAAADRPLLRRRRRRARAGALPLAAAAVGAPDAHRAARPERVERRALHARHRRQGVRARHERRAAQSAQLRRHRASVGRPVSLGPDRRRRSTSSTN